MVIGSVRKGRTADAVARMVTNQLDDIGAEYEVADLKELDLPFVNQETIPGAANEQYEDERVRTWSKKVKASDAFILVSAEYNHGPPASLKNAIDWLFGEWHNKPAAIVGYGGMGGTRAAAQLKLNILRVKLFPVAEIPIPKVKDYVKNGVVENEKAEENVRKAVKTLSEFSINT
ncbi:MAG: NAD(P)H-dependent oxidoreductase [Candidatus Saccharibacteria bacterium]|nr:NAD(P)H-dependent oxidoreductase [Candidatus Saccharibacteria bacterium]